jgi:5,10-methylenetetrahydromethanopterin reductase
VPEIIHLTTLEDWQRGQPSPYVSASLAAEGFIHCSMPSQAVLTAHRHYRGRDDLVLLRIDSTLLTAPLVYEDTSGHGVFPHLYGPIDRGAVIDVVPYVASGVEGRDGRRFGVRWGLAGGVALASVAEVQAQATWAAEAGFDSLWVSQSNAVDPVVALAAVASADSPLIEVGTSVVPLYGRHPLPLAQAVRTAQSAWGGRFTLGVGPSHRAGVESAFGVPWDRPFGFTKEFLAGLIPLLEGRAAMVEGEQLTTRGELAIDAEPTPVLLAGLGPRMLELAGAVAAGTTVGQCGPRTIRTHIRPSIRTAAEAAGRPDPRIMALVRICVTENRAAAYAQAREVGAFYSSLPSYAAVLAKEQLTEPADLHLIGSSDQVLDGLAAYALAGVTDLRIEVVAPDPDSREQTRQALRTWLATV